MELLNERKLFLDEDITVTNFAKELEMPTHHLAYFLNQHYGLSFTAYKNKLRMQHAKKLIGKGFLVNNTMDALASECGFASRSSFSKVFKNATDLSPSDYALQLQENS